MLSLLYGPILTSVHDYWKNHSFDYIDLVSEVMSLLFNMLSRLVIEFWPTHYFLAPFTNYPSLIFYLGISFLRTLYI